MSGAAERAGLNSREIENTLRSGIEAGIQSPRSAPIEPRTATNGGGNGITNRTAIGLEELPDASVGLVLDCLTQGEWGDSLLFVHLFMGKAIYDHTEKEWYIWHNHYWVRDDTGRIKHYVSGKLAGCYLRTSAKLVEGNDSDPEQKKKTDAQIAALAKRALELRSVKAYGKDSFLEQPFVLLKSYTYYKILIYIYYLLKELRFFDERLPFWRYLISAIGDLEITILLGSGYSRLSVRNKGIP